MARSKQQDIDEFMSVVGTEALVEYHYYYLDNGLLYSIRLNDRQPKPGYMPWPIVWQKDKGHHYLLKEIDDYINAGHATFQVHTDESKWKRDCD